MTCSFPGTNAARFFSAPLALLLTLPVGALERVAGPENRPDAGLLAQAKSEIPPEILALEKKAIELYERGEPQQALALIQQVMAWVTANLPSNAPYRARSQNLMGVLLSAVGRHQEALAPTEEAVIIKRELAKTDRDFLNYLAADLTTLGNLYSELGRYKEALAPSEEAVMIFRELATTDPAIPVFRGDLASVLYSLGILYYRLGLEKEALASTLEAEQIFRVLVKTNPANPDFQNGLAMALDGLGVMYGRLRQEKQALTPTIQAVRIFRELVKSNPSFREGLANSLSNLGRRYNNLSNHQEALAPIDEAAKLYRELAKTDPINSDYLGRLAMTLNSLSSVYRNLGQYKESLNFSQKAIQVCRKLISLKPANPTLQYYLAQSLGTIGHSYFNLGQWRQAQPPLLEASNIFRELAKTSPAYLGELSSTLHNLGATYLELGQLQEAIAVTHEAEKFNRELAAKFNDPQSLAYLANSLSNLAVTYNKLGQLQKALGLIQESIKIHRELSKTNPGNLNFAIYLADSLNNLGVLQKDLGHPKQARQAFNESIAILQPWDAANPFFRRKLQRMLNNLEELNRLTRQVIAANDRTYLPLQDPNTLLKRSVVKLFPTFQGESSGMGQYGTGFVVSRQGDRAWIATARHVLHDQADTSHNRFASKLEMEVYSGSLPDGFGAERLVVQLPKPSPAMTDVDLILLEVRGLPPDCQPLPLTTMPPQESLKVVGHYPMPWSVVDVNLIDKFTTSTEWKLSGAVDSGASGSPLLNNSGEVIGLVLKNIDVDNPNLKLISAYRAEVLRHAILLYTK